VKSALPYALLAALAVHVVAHVSIAVGLARSRAWARAVLALVLPPLAPWWGWEAGMQRRVVAWGFALAAYALLVALA
jgi:hypothetical protein